MRRFSSTSTLITIHWRSPERARHDCRRHNKRLARLPGPRVKFTDSPMIGRVPLPPLDASFVRAIHYDYKSCDLPFLFIRRSVFIEIKERNKGPSTTTKRFFSIPSSRGTTATELAFFPRSARTAVPAI